MIRCLARVVLCTMSLWLAACPGWAQEPQPINPREIDFFIVKNDARSLHGEKLHSLRANKQGTTSPSGELYWESENADGVRVYVHTETGKIYGESLVTGTSAHYEFHEIGQVSSDGLPSFASGATFTYLHDPQGMFWDVITVDMPIKTASAFSHPFRVPRTNQKAQ